MVDRRPVRVIVLRPDSLDHLGRVRLHIHGERELQLVPAGASDLEVPLNLVGEADFQGLRDHALELRLGSWLPLLARLADEGRRLNEARQVEGSFLLAAGNEELPGF
ncbi:hypothetical protein D9M69_608660 [compost metagenome]